MLQLIVVYIINFPNIDVMSNIFGSYGQQKQNIIGGGASANSMYSITCCNHAHHSVARQCSYTVVRSTNQSYGYSKILGGQNPKTPETIYQKIGMGDYVGDDSPHAKLKMNPHWGLGGICVKYHPHVVFSARCNLYISLLCYDVSVRLSIHLSVMEVHWRIANLGFKFRSKFTVRCGRGEG